MDRVRVQNCWKIALCLCFAIAPAVCLGQPPRVQLPPNANSNPWQGVPAPTGMFPPTGSGQPYIANQAPSTFDPYAPTFRPSTAPTSYPTYAAPVYPASPQNSIFGNFFNWGQPQPQPPLGPGPAYGNVYPNANQPFGQPTFPSSVYPNSTPNVLFPGTGSSTPINSNWAFPNQPNPYQTNPYQLNPYQPNPYQTNPNGNPLSSFNWNNWWNNTSSNFNAGTNQVVRLFQGPRFRHTWLSGSDSFNDKRPNALETNDSDVSLVFAIPNLLNSNRPFYIIPSYSQHVWEGPSVPGSDLPGSAFSAFLDFGWDTNPQQTIGLEAGGRVGVFSAFDAVNSESIRLQAKLLGRVRLTPNATLRAGVFYLDRNKIKLLPAGGLLWTPNQDTRFDLFFPEPKLSHYLATLGNSDVWWYLTGYYGGGAWTIKHTDETNDEIDINDIRLLMGLEFGRSDQIRQGFRLGFIEGGYAFDRELIYRNRSASSLDLENSIVIRAGFAY